LGGSPRAGWRTVAFPDELVPELLAPRAIRTGATLKELMARLGRSSPRAAMIYQRATRDREQVIAKALGGLARQARILDQDQAANG
jgi:hypothetical protein